MELQIELREALYSRFLPPGQLELAIVTVIVKLLIVSV